MNYLPKYEFIIKEQLTEYNEVKQILVGKEKKSCVTDANYVTHKWNFFKEINSKIIAVFLDLKRVFETINRNILRIKYDGVTFE